jgi:hypothetical protein
MGKGSNVMASVAAAAVMDSVIVRLCFVTGRERLMTSNIEALGRCARLCAESPLQGYMIANKVTIDVSQYYWIGVHGTGLPTSHVQPCSRRRPLNIFKYRLSRVPRDDGIAMRTISRLFDISLENAGGKDYGSSPEMQGVD